MCTYFYMFDTYGDGWNGNYFEIEGQTGTIDYDQHFHNEEMVCLDEGCYELFVGGGDWQSEVYW